GAKTGADVPRRAGIAAVFVERCLSIMVRMCPRFLLPAVKNKDGSQCLAVLEVGSLALVPLYPPVVHSIKGGLVTLLSGNIGHLLVKEIGDSGQVKFPSRKDVLITLERYKPGD